MKAKRRNRWVRWVTWALLGAVGLVIALAPIPTQAARPTERTIRVEASSFEYSPAVVSVRRGDRVTIELVSTDVVHGIYIDGYGVEVIADPGQTASLSFVANQVGTFRMRCSVTCGALHPFMIGKLKVGSNDLLWRAGGLAVLACLVGLSLSRGSNQNQDRGSASLA